MQRPWLTILSFAVISFIVIGFYSVYLKPIEKNNKIENKKSIEKITEPTINFVNPKKGSSTPSLTIVEYGDFQCPASKEMMEAIDIVLRAETTVQIVWKNMPNESTHELATHAAIAALCASNQGKFWDYHDELFNRQSYLSEEEFYNIANELELNTETFENCYSLRETLPLIKQDFNEALALDITATPTIFIGKDRFVGTITSQELLTTIRNVLTTLP